jgi:TolB-like protein/cytochrome c-type biogenesis protein CcmH/NrfG
LHGKQLGQYQILDKLGQGGMGEVWRARDTKLGREVALKLLPEDLAQDPERRARFEREARAIAALNHPNIVTIYAVEEIDGRPLLAMELVDGHTLTELIPEGGMPLRRLLQLAVPLADALATAHARGITHRDLKPANVMVDKAGRIRVLDFGLAKLMTTPRHESDATLAADVTGEGKVMGTASCMSPEQAEGKAIDARSDVFTLGILLYQMATGEKPFVGDTPISTITSILRDEPVPVQELKPDLPAQLGRIVKRCLEKDPDRRYDTAKGLKFELESLREDSKELAAPADAAPASRGNWRLSAILAAVSLGAVIIIALQQRDKVADRPDAPPPNPAESAAVIPEQDPTIVVFPFENLGPAEDEYFAGGITDEIATRLVGTRGLAVISRSSARQYDRTGKTMQQIADDLGVDYVLEGSVRWQRIDDDNSQVRVSPVLVHAPDDRQIWAQSYDRAMEQIFEIQSEIAVQVASQIGAVLIEGGQTGAAPPTQNMAAYHQFLRAQVAINNDQLGRKSWEVSLKLLLNVTELDPGFAEAWAYLARVHAGFCHFNWDRTPERLEAARVAAARVHELAPGCAADHLAAGYFHYWGEKRFEEAREAFNAALALRPADVETMEALAFVARREGRYEEALSMLRKAEPSTPQSWRLHYNLSETLGILRHYDEAMVEIEKALVIDPASGGGYLQKGDLFAITGQLDEALDAFRSSPDRPEDFLGGYLRCAMAAGEFEEVREILAPLGPYLPAQFGDLCPELFEAQIVHFTKGREAAADLYESAAATIREVIEQHPDDSNPRSLLGAALAGLGRCEEAVEEAEAALRLFPAVRDRWHADGRQRELARVHLLCGNTGEAERILRELCRKSTSAISIEYLRGAKLYQADSPVPEYRVVADFKL